MNEVLRLKEIFSNKHSKVLFQNPGDDDTLRYIIDCFDIGLVNVVPNTNSTDGHNGYKRARWIRKHCIWIVEEIKLNTIHIRNNINDNFRTYSSNTNVSFADPKIFNYWKFPEHSFDMLVAHNPVRLEMLKPDAIIIKF